MGATILVIGGTGMLGRPVAERLARDGFTVRIMTRDPSASRTPGAPPGEAVGGDVTDPASVEAALEGCHGVHISLSGEVEQRGAEVVALAAARQRVARISYVSGTSVADDTAWFPQTRRKLLAEKAIRESGVAYCVFCPTWFMETLPRHVKGAKAYVFGKQPNPYHFLAADDYARMVSASYRTEAAAGKRLILHGPKGYLFADALAEYCAALHPEIPGVSTMPHRLATALATVARKPEMREASDLMRFFAAAGERGDPTEANALLGAPATTLREWIERARAEHSA